MLNIELIKNILIISIASGIVTTAFVQKIKEHLKTKKYILLISIFSSLIIGTLFSLSFSNISLTYSLWVALFTFIDANIIYKTFEDKIFTSFKDLNNNIVILKENNIKDDKYEI